MPDSSNLQQHFFVFFYGEKGGLEWRQEEPNTMVMRWPDRPAEIVRTSNGYMSGIAAHNSRTPGGHPEGYIEAFAKFCIGTLQPLAFGLNLEFRLAGLGWKPGPSLMTIGCSISRPNERCPWHAVYRDDCSYRIDRE